MTAIRRIIPNASPMAAETPLLPMSKDDALFWRLLRERSQQQDERGVRV